MLCCGLYWLETVRAPHSWGRTGSARGKPMGDTFLPQIPLSFRHTYSTLSAPVLSEGLRPLFLSQCVQRAVARESSPILTPSDECYLFPDWITSCHVSSGCCSLCMTYDWVWLSLPSCFFFQLCQAQTLPGISVPTLWRALLRYFWGRGQTRCVPQIVLELQWDGDGPEITGTSHHLHQIALQRNSAAASDPF